MGVLVWKRSFDVRLQETQMQRPKCGPDGDEARARQKQIADSRAGQHSRAAAHLELPPATSNWP